MKNTNQRLCKSKTITCFFAGVITYYDKYVKPLTSTETNGSFKTLMLIE